MLSYIHVYHALWCVAMVTSVLYPHCIYSLAIKSVINHVVLCSVYFPILLYTVEIMCSNQEFDEWFVYKIVG